MANLLHFGWRCNAGLLRSILAQGDISNVKYRSENPEDVILLFVGEADGAEGRLRSKALSTQQHGYTY